MKKVLFLFVWLSFSSLYAQDSPTVTLNDCYEAAIENYPNLKQMDMAVQINALNKKNLQTTYLPSLNLNGQASYQSDVTKVPIAVPGINIPTIANDWYALNLDVEQKIYDGGLTNARKRLEDVNLELTQQQLQIEFYELKDRVNQLFFNALLLRKALEILNVLQQNLQTTIQEAEVAMENGAMLSADVDALKVEYHLVMQQIIELREDIRSVTGSLQVLTGLAISNPDVLAIPEVVVVDYRFVNNRPEYVLLGKQQTKIQALTQITQSKRNPFFMAFGQAGYGRPGYDMLNNNFDTYYKVGVRLHWNIWDWNQVAREKMVFNVQNEMITTQKQSFDQNLKAALETKLAAIKKAEELITTDSTIVALQQNVVNAANVQLRNGTLTTTNYIIELNKQIKARLNMEVHKLQLIYSKYQYNITLGNI